MEEFLKFPKIMKVTKNLAFLSKILKSFIDKDDGSSAFFEVDETGGKIRKKGFVKDKIKINI